jgi:hypothetical protein
MSELKRRVLVAATGHEIFRQQIVQLLSAISHRKRVVTDQTRYRMAQAKFYQQPSMIVSAVRGWLVKVSIGFGVLRGVYDE